MIIATTTKILSATVGQGRPRRVHDLPFRKQRNGGSTLGENGIKIFATTTEGRPEPSSGRSARPYPGVRSPEPRHDLRPMKTMLR
jgi:hypothetical protein